MNAMVEGYLVCALWTDLQNEEGDQIDDKGIIDCTPEMITQAEKECEEFKTLAGGLVDKYLETFNEEQMGHDFWLTRNGHGAGFWDRGLESLGKELTDIAKTFGTCDIYLNDNDKVDCT